MELKITRREVLKRAGIAAPAAAIVPAIPRLAKAGAKEYVLVLPRWILSYGVK